MADVELFSFTACPYAQRSRLVLLEKAIGFELVEIDLHNRPAWFSEVSPYGKVPVLRHQGRVVYESAIINQYVDEAFPDRPLMPADPFGRAQARIWMDYCDTRYLPAAHRLMVDRESPEKRATALGKLNEVLRFIEFEGLRKLSDGPYWLGVRPSLVDFHFLPFFERFAVYVELAGAAWLPECTRLRSWYDTVASRDSFIATRHTLDFHLDQQRRLNALRAQQQQATISAGVPSRPEG
ncbi:MAG: glutathione S-transferase family protein [Gammaproteobacteria bacterium]|nr:glutathione S-transferase family protein [Gammaproteobacteria bacterium]